jgi:hypothetical protein
MSDWKTKVYIIQKADGKVVGAKLTFSAAHQIALDEAPARVLFAIAVQQCRGTRSGP